MSKSKKQNRFDKAAAEKVARALKGILGIVRKARDAEDIDEEEFEVTFAFLIKSDGKYGLEVKVVDESFLHTVTWYSRWPHEIKIGCSQHAIASWLLNADAQVDRYSLDEDDQAYYAALLRLFGRVRVPYNMTLTKARILRSAIKRVVLGRQDSIFWIYDEYL